MQSFRSVCSCCWPSREIEKEVEIISWSNLCFPHHRHRHHHHHHRFSIHHRSTRLPPLHKNPRWFTLSLSPPINRRRLCHCIGIALTIDGWSITAAIDRGRRSSSETLTIVLSLVDCTVSHHRRPGSSPISNR